MRALRVPRQDVREIEHPEPRILAAYVEVRKVVDGRRGRQRIPRARAAVGGAYRESVEFPPPAADPQRQREKVAQHAQRRGQAAEPDDARRVREPEAPQPFLEKAVLAQERELVALRRQFAHRFARVDGYPALSAVVGDAGNEYSHDSSANSALIFASDTGFAMTFAK